MSFLDKKWGCVASQQQKLTEAKGLKINKREIRTKSWHVTSVNHKTSIIVADEDKFGQRPRPRQRPCSSSTHEASATESGKIAQRKPFHFAHWHFSRNKHVFRVVWFPSTAFTRRCSSGGERQTQYNRLESCHPQKNMTLNTCKRLQNKNTAFSVTRCQLVKV